MSDLQTRPQALDVLPENIPAELKARPAWVCWRYEWNERREKWDKVPYIPYTVKNASSTRESTWRSFEAAYGCYQERRDFFDGVFFALSDNDPYTGGDFDHCDSSDSIPDTYAECSPSGNGQRFIGLGTIPSACKKPAGELYSRARFLSITGHKLPGSPPDIRAIQTALDALYGELKGSKRSGPAADKSARDGTASDTDRAALAAEHEADFEEGRRLLRTKRDLILKRFLLATQRDGTQGYYSARSLWSEMHQRWPFIGLYRADGSLDDSQTRVAVACTVYGYGFSFAEYTVIMSDRFAGQALAKWGTKQSWREELAALWRYAIAHTPYKPKAPRPAPKRDVIKKPVGRPTHAPEVERFYWFLREQIISDEPVKTSALAATFGIDRRTAITYLDDLRHEGRIQTVRKSHGLVISFTQSHVIEIIPAESAECSITTPTTALIVTPLEETRVTCVSSDPAEVDHITRAARTIEPVTPMPRTLREAVALVLSQVDQYEFGRQRLPTVRQTLAVVYGYADLAAVNLEIKRQESIFGKERRECWRMEPEKLFTRISARTKAATRNVGKHQEGKYRMLLQIADEVRQKRGLVMPEKATTIKAVKPTKPKQVCLAGPRAPTAYSLLCTLVLGGTMTRSAYLAVQYE